MAYILGREEKRYDFKSLNRRQKIEFTKLLKDSDKQDFEKVEEYVYTLLKFNYPQITKDEFEDILDYNVDTFGFEETYEMLGYIIEDVFTQVGGDKKPNPYLEAKREEHKAKAIQ